MIYSLLVVSSPHSGYSARSAVKFAAALIRRGHTLQRVFFIDDGVFAATDSRVLPQDEEDVMATWTELAKDHQVDLVLCIASAIKRGILDEAEALRYEQKGATATAGFTISGLGQLLDAAEKSDRLITFGG